MTDETPRTDPHTGEPVAAPEPAPAEAAEDNEVSRLAAGKPILTSGSSDERVVELTAKLNELGYDVPVGPDVNAQVLAAVRQFRADHDVSEDEAIAAGGSIDNYIGPGTWAALAQL